MDRTYADCQRLITSTTPVMGPAPLFIVALGRDDPQTRRNQLHIPVTQRDLTKSSGLIRLDTAQWDGPMRDAVVAGRTNMPTTADVLD